MRFRGANPVYKRANYEAAYDDSYRATYGGVVTKTSILLGIIAVTALYFANTINFNALEINYIYPVFVAPIVAIIAIIMTHRMPQIAFATSVVYGVAEGVFLGFISAIYAYAFGGEIVQMALIGTFGVLAGMLFLYASGIIRVGAFFTKFMYSMLIGLLFGGIILIALSFFTGLNLSGAYFGFVTLSVIVSSLFLLVDFNRISYYVEAGASKEAEWSLALGLVVTLVWIYVELLRFIAILTNRN